MNYVVEIRLFYDRIEIVPLSSAAIVLWHTLMYLANKAGWPEELSVSIGTLIARSRLERRGVYRARVVLRDGGFIEFREQTGNRSALYKIISQADLQYKNVPQNDTQDESCSTDLHHKMSHTEGEQYKNVPQIVTQSITQTESPNGEIPNKYLSNNDLPSEDDADEGFGKSETDPYISIYKKIDKKYNGVVRGKKKKPEFDLSFIGDEVWEGLVESWLEYKRSRSENYKSEMSVKKFHTMLRNYSRGDPALARQIIDKSIANNWAGIFELAPDDGKARSTVGQPARPATGQRIGQIKQPEDEERRRKLLEKFGRGACPERDSGGNDTNKK